MLPAIHAKNGLGGGFKILAIVCQILCATAFVGPQIWISDGSTRYNNVDRSCSSTTALSAGGFGGGSDAVKSKSKNSKNKKSTSSTSFDVSAAISRTERKYDELREADAKRLAKEDDSEDDDNDDSPKPARSSSDDIVTTEYVVAVRPSPSSNSAIPDWVPVGQLILARKSHPSETNSHHNDDDSRLLLHTAVSLYCRELAQLAVFGSRVFSNVPRNQLEYSVEASGSFYKYVYDKIKSKGSDNDENMTNAEARKILGFETSTTSSNGIDRATLRKTYRSLSMEWHPDRMIGQSEEKQLEAAAYYTQIKRAYETLAASGTMSNTLSWYESLGGRERTDFFKLEGPLSPIASAQQALELRAIESAVAGLDPALVQGFVARSSSRANV